MQLLSLIFTELFGEEETQQNNSQERVTEMMLPAGTVMPGNASGDTLVNGVTERDQKDPIQNQEWTSLALRPTGAAVGDTAGG